MTSEGGSVARRFPTARNSGQLLIECVAFKAATVVIMKCYQVVRYL